MNERDSEELNRQRQNPEFKELETQLYMLYSRLLLNDIKAKYLPDDGRSGPRVESQVIVIKPRGWDEAQLESFISDFKKEAERIAWKMARFFPKTRRLDWKERFVAYAFLGDYHAIPSRDIFFITGHLPPAEEKNFIALAETYKNDDTAKAILGSFNEATNDPDDELVHLYEVWEALRSKLGDEKSALTELSISRKQKKHLTMLADSEPIRQGRHRGRFAGELRDATGEELQMARRIAANMIYAYLKYLDRTTNTTSNTV